MAAPESAASSAGLFPTPHWSVVLAAGQHPSTQSLAALETLCRTYWYPLYAFVRHRGHSPEDAQDLVQGFFARLLEKQDLAKVEPGPGPFRCFLLTALRHFLANEWDAAKAAKRGGGQKAIPLDEVLAEDQYHREPGHNLTPDRLYERSWALTVLEQVRGRLREEFAVAGKAERFGLVEKFLPGEESPLTCAQVGERLGLSDGTVKSEVHRLRQRYRAVLREQIAQTLATPEEVAAEIRHLIAVLSE